jgi:hypothetical protein
MGESYEPLAVSDEYLPNFITTIKLLLGRSVYLSVFLASGIERSETPMNIGVLLYYNNSIHNRSLVMQSWPLNYFSK